MYSTNLLFTKARALGTRLFFILALVMVVLASSGCGATLARARVSGAKAALAGAERAGAEELAPYEFTAALLYLEKAMEMEAYARFGPAIEFGGLSEKLAKQALEKAASVDSGPEQ